jgi:hypothetical protein
MSKFLFDAGVRIGNVLLLAGCLIGALLKVGVMENRLLRTHLSAAVERRTRRYAHDCNIVRSRETGQQVNTSMAITALTFSFVERRQQNILIR